MKPNKPVRIINNIPAVVADGHGIGINPDNGAANLLFLQLILNQAQSAEEAKKQIDEAAFVDASVVANIRMTLEQLEQLNQEISDTIAKHKSKDGASEQKDTK